MAEEAVYTEDSIQSLDWKEHIRMRPGMYIGKLGDGSAGDDGIYVLVKEILDNAIDEFVMGAGSKIEIEVTEHHARIRDYGRGIPLGKVIDCVSRINTGGKYDSQAFKKSVGLNGVGTKAVNALSTSFRVTSIRDGEQKVAAFERGELSLDAKVTKSSEKNGTLVEFEPDPEVFRNYRFRPEFLENMIWNYVFLNAGLTVVFNGRKFKSENGLKDLLEYHIGTDPIRYPIIHLKGEDIEVALTHGNQYGEEHYSFVNGQHTTMGGTHQSALREALVRTARDHFKKEFDAADIRQGVIAAISVRIQEPVFESQTKTKLGSSHVYPDGPTIRTWINDFLRTDLDNYLHRHSETAEAMEKRIKQSERERKEMAGIKKLANERAKKASVFNRKLRDCRIHLTDNHERARDSTLFICEGDSASGSITKARDIQTQAVFSLRGKPLNAFGKTKKVVYENEEFNLLQHALDIEEGIENLRFNRVVIATDADVDGMHIRLLLMTFFLQFFPELVKGGHVHILQTPLFRVRDKKQTFYCYTPQEKQDAINTIGQKKAEITRFKGLGEISPEEFSQFIGEDIRLEPVLMTKDTSIQELLRYFMGSNSQDRQEFIIDNLRVEDNVELAELVEAPAEGDAVGTADEAEA